MAADGNGPSKEEFEEFLAEYGEIRFDQMRDASRAAKLKSRWEAKGGDFKQQIKYGFELGQLTPDEQRARSTERSRVEAWSGIATVIEDSGQISFTVAFDQKPVEHGFGGAPLGSRLSLGRARADGYNIALHGGSLADCLLAAESEEAAAWAKGYGEGMEDRVEPPPRPRKPGKPATEEMAETAGAMPQSESEQAVVAEAKKRRGRPPKLPAPGSDDELPAAIH